MQETENFTAGDLGGGKGCRGQSGAEAEGGKAAEPGGVAGRTASLHNGRARGHTLRKSHPQHVAIFTWYVLQRSACE